MILMILACMVGGATVGVLFGLIPFALGRSQGKPNMGQWALIWSIVAGMLTIVGPLFVLIGFIIAILTKENDFRPIKRSPTYVYVNPQPQPQPQPQPAPAPGLCLKCLSGPLSGRTYNIGAGGLTFGRDVDCAIRFPEGTAGISRHHCALRWQQGTLVLVDLGSKFGTFQGDGRQLPQNYPVGVAAGSRFYLVNPANLFQIAIQ